MKRFILLALVAAFVLGCAAVAGATELKVSGEFQVNADFSRNVPFFMDSKSLNATGSPTGTNNNTVGGVAGTYYGGKTRAEGYDVHQRMRNYFTFVANENLKAVWGVEIGTTYWGRMSNPTLQAVGVNNVGQSSGGGLDGDGVNIETKWAYLDFNVPGSTVNVKAGLLPVVFPNAFGPSSAVLDSDIPALVVSTPITDMFSVIAAYTRVQDQAVSTEAGRNWDELDAVFLALPITPLKGLSATPWGSYMLAGKGLGVPTFTSASQTGANVTAGITTPLLPGSSNTMGLLAPVNIAKLNAGSASDQTKVWFGGLAFDLKLFDPFVFDADFIYGSEKNSGLDIDRAGWMADARIQYKGLGTLGTPNLFAMYSSGEDDNSFNVAGAASTGNHKSERMPFVWERWQIPGSMWFGGSAFDVTGSGTGRIADYQGMSNVGGTWTVGLGMYGMSFLEGLTHDLLVLYAQGTNNKNSVAMLRQEGYGIGTALTTKDHLIEVDFNHQYQIYEQLQAIIELGMIIPSYDKNIGWNGPVNADGTITNASFTTDNAWRVLFGLKYKY